MPRPAATKKKSPSPKRTSLVPNNRQSVSMNSSAISNLIPNTAVLIIWINVALYAFAYWISSPSIPYLLKKHSGGGNSSNNSTSSGGSLSFGAFQSVFNLAQVGGGLVLGIMTDHFSGSMALNICALGSAAVYGCLLIAAQAPAPGAATATGGAAVFSALSFLYISRVLSVLQQVMQIAQAVISKTVAEQHSAVQMARLSLFYAVGMIGGSALSGVESVTTEMQMMVAIAASLLPIVLNVLFLTGDDKLASLAEKRHSGGKKSGDSHKKKHNYISIIAQIKGLLVLLACCYATRSVFEPVNQKQLVSLIDQKQNARLTSALAVVGLVGSLGLLPLLKKLFHDDDGKVVKAAIVMSAACYLALSVLPFTFETYALSMGGLALGGSVLYSVLTAMVAKKTPTAVRGQSVALTHALRSGIGIVLPLVAVFILDNYGFASVTSVNVALLGVAFFLV